MAAIQQTLADAEAALGEAVATDATTESAQAIVLVQSATQMYPATCKFQPKNKNIRQVQHKIKSRTKRSRCRLGNIIRERFTTPKVTSQTFGLDPPLST